MKYIVVFLLSFHILITYRNTTVDTVIESKLEKTPPPSSSLTSVTIRNK